jgi:hypothetical protein
MHRVKGLEFEYLIVVAANEGILPLKAAVVDAEDAVARRDVETGPKPEFLERVRSMLPKTAKNPHQEATGSAAGSVMVDNPRYRPGSAQGFFPQRAAAALRAISARRLGPSVARPFATFAFPPLRPSSARSSGVMSSMRLLPKATAAAFLRAMPIL